MPSFGQKLKAEREKRSITLDQISLTTKIGTRMLQALEEDKFSQLPGGIFNKGFVRAYARCVGIDEEQAVSDYLQASGEAPPPRTEAEVEAGAEPPPPGRSVFAAARELSSSSRELPWGLFAALLLVIALALSVWTRQKHDAAPVSAPVAPVSPASGNVSPPSTAANTDNNKGPITPAAKPAIHAAPQPSGEKPAETKTSKSSEAASGLSTATPPVPPGQPGQFTVLVQGRENCWISITADGKTIASYLLTAGEQRAVRGRESIIIKAGNVGGLDVLFNGKKIALQGASGEVKTLTFGPEGLEASSASDETHNN